MDSNISILSVIYHTCNFSLFKYIVCTLFAIIIQIICLYNSYCGQFSPLWAINCTFYHFSTILWVNPLFYPKLSAILCFYPKKYISRIPAVLIRIWESQFSSVSGQLVRLEDIFNIVVYGEISSGLHSSVIGFVL